MTHVHIRTLPNMSVAVVLVLQVARRLLSASSAVQYAFPPVYLCQTRKEKKGRKKREPRVAEIQRDHQSAG
jgi:hypothetical protein